MFRAPLPGWLSTPYTISATFANPKTNCVLAVFLSISTLEERVLLSFRPAVLLPALQKREYLGGADPRALHILARPFVPSALEQLDRVEQLLVRRILRAEVLGQVAQHLLDALVLDAGEPHAGQTLGRHAAERRFQRLRDRFARRRLVKVGCKRELPSHFPVVLAQY